jgi:hypothetical protein
VLNEVQENLCNVAYQGQCLMLLQEYHPVVSGHLEAFAEVQQRSGKGQMAEQHQGSVKNP